MFYREHSRIPQSPWIVLLLSAVLLLPWLGEAYFSSKGEPREALVAVAMLDQGDFVLPMVFGQDMAYKPPLLAWLIAGLAWLLNGGVVTEYLSRLPSALAAIALVMSGFAWARRARGDRFAMLMSIVTLTCFEVYRAAVACRVDMVLTAAMVIPMYMLYRVAERGDKRHRKADAAYYVCAILLLSCAVLTKGPVGSLLPCAAMGVYLLLRGRKFVPTFFKMLGVAVAAFLIPAIWYYAAYLRGGDAFVDLMMEENFGRLTGTMSYSSHEEPFYYNFLTLLAGCLPWTLMALLGLIAVRRYQRRRLEPAGLLSLVAVIVIVGFYCIPSSKRSVYLLPAYPFVCYAIASLVDSPDAKTPVRIFAWIVAVLAVVAPVTYCVLTITGVPGVNIATPPWYGYLILALPVAAGVAWIMNRHSPVGHLAVGVWALFVAYGACIMPSVMNPLSDKNLLPELGIGQQTQVLCVPEPPVGGSIWRPYTLDFYLHDRVRVVDTWDEAADYPAGTVVISPFMPDDGAAFDVSTATNRGCDYRRPLIVGVKKTM